MAHRQRWHSGVRWRRALAGLVVLAAVGCGPVGGPSPLVVDPGLEGIPATTDVSPAELRTYVQSLRWDRSGNRSDTADIDCDSNYVARLRIEPERRAPALLPSLHSRQNHGRFVARITSEDGKRCPLFEIRSTSDTAYLWMGRVGAGAITAAYYKVDGAGKAELVARGRNYQELSGPDHPPPKEPRARWRIPVPAGEIQRRGAEAEGLGSSEGTSANAGMTRALATTAQSWLSCSLGCCTSGDVAIQ